MHLQLCILRFTRLWTLHFDLVLLVWVEVGCPPLARPGCVREGAAVVEARPGSGPAAAVVTCQHISGPLEVLGVHALGVVPAAAAAAAGDAPPAAAAGPQQGSVRGGASEGLLLPPVQPIQGLTPTVILPQEGVH